MAGLLQGNPVGSVVLSHAAAAQQRGEKMGAGAGACSRRCHVPCGSGWSRCPG